MSRKHYYAIVGNGETIALINQKLSIEWFCPGRFDDFPLFAASLDPEKGGRLELAISTGGKTLETNSQKYVDRTNVLETVLANDCCRAVVTDLMPWQNRVLLRQVELANLNSEPVTAQVTLNLQSIETRFCDVQNEVQDGLWLVNLAVAPNIVEFLTPGQSSEMSVALGATIEYPEREESGPVALAPEKGSGGKWQQQFSLPLEAGERAVLFLALAYSPSPLTAASTLRSSLEHAAGLIRLETRFWQQWLAQAKEPPVEDEELVEAYYRSLLVLKLLTYEETGAIVAAPTGSFPATPGGDENWDYRYVWLRDGYYTALAFDRAGLQNEARRFYDFVGRLQRLDGDWRRPLTTVTGHNPREFVISDLQGPGGEKPIRFGNKAADQLQLDNTGNVLDGVWQHYRLTEDRRYLQAWWPRVVRAAEWVMHNWRRRESGIWEMRDEPQHWVHGKAMCYVALKVAALIARELGEDEFIEDWEEEAARIKSEVIERGWSEERQAFVEYYGADILDISVLALAFYDLLPADDPRLKATVEAMEKDLSSAKGLNINGGIARYDFAVKAFYLPTLWLARYYLAAGNRERALELIRTCLANATDLYLMAEHFDAVKGTQWGNFPQAFSHEELIHTILELQE